MSERFEISAADTRDSLRAGLGHFILAASAFSWAIPAMKRFLCSFEIQAEIQDLNPGGAVVFTQVAGGHLLGLVSHLLGSRRLGGCSILYRCNV